MSRVTVDERLRTTLNGLSGATEVCDETGRLLGYFVAPEVYHRLQGAWLQCPYTDEELQKHMQEAGGSTLAEIWRRMSGAGHHLAESPMTMASAR